MLGCVEYRIVRGAELLEPDKVAVESYALNEVGDDDA
jgi:hypothetical protein